MTYKNNQSSDNSEIESYRKMVEKHYQKKEVIEFDNSSVVHAEIVAEYLFKYAIEEEKDIKIFTGMLKKSFYDKFTEQAKTILNKNKISIICEKKCEESNFQDLINKSDRGEISDINAQENIGVSHFILAGDSAYRDEKSDALKTAEASFNGYIRGSFLSVLFDTIKKNIEKLA